MKNKKYTSIMIFHDELCQVFNGLMTALSLLRAGSLSDAAPFHTFSPAARAETPPPVLSRGLIFFVDLPVEFLAI
jgi:hypothetical protein